MSESELVIEASQGEAETVVFHGVPLRLLPDVSLHLAV